MAICSHAWWRALDLSQAIVSSLRICYFVRFKMYLTLLVCDTGSLRELVQQIVHI